LICPNCTDCRSARGKNAFERPSTGTLARTGSVLAVVLVVCTASQGNDSTYIQQVTEVMSRRCLSLSHFFLSQSFCHWTPYYPFKIYSVFKTNCQLCLPSHSSLRGTLSSHWTVHYSTLQYSAVQYSTVQYRTVEYTTVHYSTVRYSTVQYTTLHYTTLQYSTVQYSI
jgi:hypothetical protein